MNCDSEGYYSEMMDCIVDHKRNGSAVIMDEKYINSNNVQMKLRQTTVGRSFLVIVKYITKSWTPLNILKESISVDIAEYTLAHRIKREPDFERWVG